MKNDQKFSDYVEYLFLGTEIAGAIMIPILLGYWLDTYFQLSPWLLLTGCVVGVVNFFILVFQLNDRLTKE